MVPNFCVFCHKNLLFWLDVVKILVTMLESIAAALGEAEPRVAFHGSAIWRHHFFFRLRRGVFPFSRPEIICSNDAMKYE